MGARYCVVICVWVCAWPMTARAECHGLAGQSIRFVVPNSTGSAYDTYVRAMEALFARNIGADIFIENVSGGGGIVGARDIASAAPDGRTLGIINGTGILSATLAGRPNVPSLLNDFVLLGKASQMQHVWAVAAQSNFRTVADLRQAAAESPIVLGVRNVASTSFASLTVGVHLLGIPHAIVSGYASNRDTRLAVMRGEIDLVSMDYSSGHRQLANGSLRSLLKISKDDFETADNLAEVATLQEELSAEQAPSAAQQTADALYDLLTANRLFVAPASLAPATAACLESALAATLADTSVAHALDAAASSIDYVDGATARLELQRTMESLFLLQPIISAAIRQLNP